MTATFAMNSPDPGAAALELHGLTRRYPGVLALDGVDLTLLPGEVHALAGENGAGKSSLIKILCGADRADGGQMTLFGAPYAPNSPLDAIRCGIRVVHQELHMLDGLQRKVHAVEREHAGVAAREAMELECRGTAIG